MKIELKNIKVNLAFSQETTMFKADVFADGKKIAYAENDGRGGNTWYHAYPNMQHELKVAEEYAKTLPSKFYGDLEIKSDLESLIDFALEDHINAKEVEKFKKKREKATEKYIVWGLPDGTTYNTLGYKNLTIQQVLAHPAGKLTIETTLKKIKKEMAEGEVIFNKNLQEIFAGVK